MPPTRLLRSRPRPVDSEIGRRNTRIVAAFRLASGVFTGAVLVGVAHRVASFATGHEMAPSWMIIVFAAIAAVGFAFAEIVFGGRAAHAEEKRIRRALLTRLFASSAYDQDFGSIVQLATDNTERVTQYRQVYLGSTIAALALPFVILTYVGVAYDPVLGFSVMALVPVIPVLLGVFLRVFRASSAHSRKERARLAGQYLDAIRNLVIIRLYGAGERIEKQLRAQGETNRQAIMRLLAGNQVVIIIVDGLFSLILVCATITIAILRYRSGALSLEGALAAAFLTTLLVEPLVQVAGFFYIGMGGIASQRAIRHYLDSLPAGQDSSYEIENLQGEMAGNTGSGRTNSAAAAGAETKIATFSDTAINSDTEINMAAVSYDYGNGLVLDHVNLQVRAGQRVVIIGRSGGGKSTLLNILRGALAPQLGSLSVVGQDVLSMTPAQVRRLSASVSQQTWLFTGTIADNLRLARQASTQEMWDALTRAGLREEVQRMPAQLETNVGERGSLISGGQAQRISIARAILSGRRILLFDEPTSQVDMESEARITQAISSLGREWTIVLVTHRESMLDFADVIYEMVDGHLIQLTYAQAKAKMKEDA